MRLTARDRTISFPRRPLVMGIVNINTDSFSGDGDLDVSRALDLARQMTTEGADIIDVGGESARPNRPAISPQEEIDRVAPFIKQFALMVADLQTPPLLSINTWRPEVARPLLEVGGDILNDMSALPTPDNATICATTGAALLIMHSMGEPKISHREIHYRDVMQELESFFENRIALARSVGVKEDQLILDPGIEFAKQQEDNLTIYRELSRLHRFDRPLLLPVSRKSIIGEVLDIKDPARRDAGTVACIIQGMDQGAQIFRVHNVAAATQTVKLLHAVAAAQ